MVISDKELLKLESPVTRYTPVSKQMSDDAIRILNERISKGEDPYEILKIRKSFSYYVEKIVNGLINIDDTLYYRITNNNPYIDHYYEITTSVDRENDENEMRV